MSSIDGETTADGAVTSVDVPFSDVLENLDYGFMAYVEHRNMKWSFIGDVFYADLGASEAVVTQAGNPANIDVDLKQSFTEAFIGYRVYQQRDANSTLGIDILAGARYNSIRVDLDAQETVGGMVTAGNVEQDETWTDAVLGARLQYKQSNGWGFTGLFDLGTGSDSDSYQLNLLATKDFKENFIAHAGYRLYHFEHTTSSNGVQAKIDLDFSGPLIGIGYRF